MLSSIRMFVLAWVILLPQSSFAGPNATTVFGPVQMPDFDIPYHDIAQDSRGFVYLAGPASSDHGVTPKAYDTTFNGGVYDIFVAKFAPQSLEPIAVTLLGGIGEEWCRAIMIDQDGNVVLTGSTTSPDFAGRNNSAKEETSSDEKIFVVRLDGDLKKVLALNLIGSGKGFALAEGLDGGIYVAGETSSPHSFPVRSEEGWDLTYNGGENDAFVAKVDVGLTLFNATFIGGSGRELALTIVTSKTGDVVVAGFTDSNNFPVFDKAFGHAQTESSGNGFVVRFTPDLKTMKAAAQLGGSNHDVIHALALGKDDSVYVTGLTLSPDFPVTSGSYDESYNGDADIFVSRLSAPLEKVISSTFLGGAKRDGAFSLVFNDDQNVYVAGDTDSFDFPDSPGDTLNTAKEGAGDIVSAKLDGALSTVNEITFVGGKLNERVPSMLIGSHNQKILTGMTNSKNFPLDVPAKVWKGEEKYRLFLTYINETAILNQK